MFPIFRLDRKKVTKCILQQSKGKLKRNNVLYIKEKKVRYKNVKFK